MYNLAQDKLYETRNVFSINILKLYTKMNLYIYIHHFDDQVSKHEYISYTFTKSISIS